MALEDFAFKYLIQESILILFMFYFLAFFIIIIFVYLLFDYFVISLTMQRKSLRDISYY